MSILSKSGGENKKSYLHEWILDRYAPEEGARRNVMVSPRIDLLSHALVSESKEHRATKVNDEQLYQMVQNKAVHKTPDRVGGSNTTCELCVVYDVSKMVFGSYDCVELAVKPPVKVCVYPVDMDTQISRQILSTGMWEPSIVNRFQELLSRDPRLGVIDVGANLGLYSLIAASHGHPVLAIEPYLENIWHMHRAIQLQHLHNITILHNAVSETEGTAWLVLNDNNQGDVRVNTEHDQGQSQVVSDHTEPIKLDVNTVTMDKLLPFITFKRAILKLDIQGYEHKAFAQASNLLNKIYVPYIFMEWVFMREFHKGSNTNSDDEVLVENMLHLLKVKGYTPFSATGHSKLELSSWAGWPDDVLWVQELAELLT